MSGNGTYRDGYYDGFIAALSALEKRFSVHMERQYKHPQLLDADGQLCGEGVIAAHVDAQEDVERYAYSVLQDWQHGRIENLPVLDAVDIVDAKAIVS